MGQFDVHRIGRSLFLDCQSDLLSALNTRVVVPLISLNDAPKPARRFNPIFTIDEQEVVMDTQYLSSIESRHLGPVVSSLADHSFEITDALDVLISGV